MVSVTGVTALPAAQGQRIGVGRCAYGREGRVKVAVAPGASVAVPELEPVP
jgi:hypothetical protein